METCQLTSASINQKIVAGVEGKKKYPATMGEVCVLNKRKHKVVTASYVQWHFERVLGLRSITLNNIIKDQETVFCNSEAIIHK
jgi:hypothetical protein